MLISKNLHSHHELQEKILSYYLNDQKELRKYYLQSLFNLFSTNLNDPLKNTGRVATNNIIKRSRVQSKKLIGVLV